MWGAGQMMFNKILVIADGNVNINDYKTLAQYVFNNMNPATDIYFSQGPMDVLDHSCSKMGFGGKMCIDGTKKWEEEKVNDLLPFSFPVGLTAEKLTASFPQITSINVSLAKDHGIPVFFIAVRKQKAGHVAELHQNICQLPELQGIKMILYVEHTVNAADIADVLWRFCNNLDPKRDHFYAGKNNSIIGLDGTRKTKDLDGFERPWPNIIVADDATIRSVDEKWAQLGLGDLIPSPSLKYKNQMYGEEAQVAADI